MVKIVVSLFNRIPLSIKKEWTIDTHNIDKPQNHYTGERNQTQQSP